MAILIPQAPKKCPNGERLVYERIGRELPADWVALHSLGLPRHKSKIWGEADIVLLTSAGIFAIEVKGGSVSCADGVWTYTGPDFKSYSKKEDPWTQAKTAMMAVMERLQTADSRFSDTLFGYGVMMPFTRFTATGAEILPEVLTDRRDFRQPFHLRISRLERYWDQTLQSKHGRSYRGLTSAEIRMARQILRPDLETVLSVGGFLTGVDACLVQLTNEQIRISRRVAANPRTLVRGAAGTGKSILAVERARQLAGGGRRVLFLCYNDLLADHFRTALAASEGLDVRHAHDLYSEIIRKGGLLPELEALDADAPDFFSREFPELAGDALCAAPFEAYDALVVDEAQDLMTPYHLDVLDLLVKGGLNQGVWHFFYDPLQNLYSSDIVLQVEGRLKEAHPAFDDLFENCRNTRQVAVQTSIMSGLDLPVAGAPEGLACDNIYYRSNAEAIAKLEETVKTLLGGDVRPQDIVILSPRRRENSLLSGISEVSGHRLADARDPEAAKRGTIIFSTMHSFKGLERMVVLAIDMKGIGDPRLAMLHYAGLSRARCLLHCFVPSGEKAAYDRQARDFGARLASSES